MTTTGNSIDGTQTMVTTGSQSYTVSQTNTDGSDNYTLSETGTKDYTRTENDNAENGISSIGETGTDSYTMVQNGTSSGSVYTVTVSGTDTYTIADDENAQTGSFDSVTSGTDDYTVNQSPFFLSGQNPFSSTEVGNSFAGTMSLTQSGTSRYDLLTDFNNTSDGANGATGMADFSPVGLPILIQRQSVPAGTFDKLGDVAHKYCFARGTQVLLADGSYQAIEKIETGTMVLAAPENDPEATPTACRVLEVYHNPPARIWEVKVQDEVIRTTAGHPFYVKERGWTKVQDMGTNDRLRTHEGKWVAVQAVRDSGRSEPVFNFCVAESHTYFVELKNVGSTLVHNDSLAVTHITEPANVASIIKNGFIPKEAGLSWFSGPGAGAPFTPVTPAAQRIVDAKTSSLSVKLNDLNLPEATPQMLEEADRYADAAIKANPKAIVQGPLWWSKKWEYVRNAGGKSFENGFKVANGGGYDYALTESGLAKAAPTITGGTEDVMAALGIAAKAEGVGEGATVANGIVTLGRVNILLTVLLAAERYTLGVAADAKQQHIGFWQAEKNKVSGDAEGVWNFVKQIPDAVDSLFFSRQLYGSGGGA